MISTTWTATPAGLAGPGAVALPSYACPAVVGGTGARTAPTAAPFQGTGLPVAPRLRLIDERGANSWSFLAQAVAVPGAAPLSAITEHDSTTLGIHSPGRPQS